MLNKTPLPPRDPKTESFVLGCLMIDGNNTAWDRVASLLTPECFYKQTHRWIYEAMLSLVQRGLNIDVLAVVEQLKTDGHLNQSFGPAQVMEVTYDVTTTTYLPQHATTLVAYKMRRDILSVCYQTISSYSKGHVDPMSLLDEMQESLSSVLPNVATGTDLGTYAKQSIENLERIQSGNAPYLPTPWESVDNAAGCFIYPSDLIIIAARPGMGKTSFVCDLMRHISKQGHPCGFFSLEMSGVQVFERLVAAEVGIQSSDIRTGQLNDHDLQLYYEGIDKMHGLPIFIDDRGGLTIQEIAMQANTFVKQHGVKIIIIDHLQFVNRGNLNEYAGISALTQASKELAKTLDVPVILVSQLNRKVEDRTGSRPELQDLRGSGTIEQDADFIGFLYRAEYYKIYEDEDGYPTRGKAEFITAKNRHKAPSTAMLNWNGDNVTFSDPGDQIFDDSAMWSQAEAPTSFTDKMNAAKQLQQANGRTIINELPDDLPF